MDNIEIMEMINNFSIGSIPQNRLESLSKAEIVAFLARFQDQFLTIKNIDERELQIGEVLPSLFYQRL